MRNTFRTVAMIAAVVPAFAFASRVSAQGIAGVWETSMPTRVTIEGGQPTGSNFATVTMTVEVRGDSIFATSKRGPVEGMPDAPERKLKGTFKDGVATLVSEPTEAKMNMNGDEHTITMTTTYTLKLDGDVLSGQAKSVSSDENVQSQPRDMKFTRKKS